MLQNRISQIISITLLIYSFIGCTVKEPENQNNYSHKITMSNGWVSGSEFFDYYTKSEDGKWYRFYSKDSILIGEWERPEGWTVSIRRLEGND